MAEKCCWCGQPTLRTSRIKDVEVLLCSVRCTDEYRQAIEDRRIHLPVSTRRTYTFTWIAIIGLLILAGYYVYPHLVGPIHRTPTESSEVPVRNTHAPQQALPQKVMLADTAKGEIIMKIEDAVGLIALILIEKKPDQGPRHAIITLLGKQHCTLACEVRENLDSLHIYFDRIDQGKLKGDELSKELPIITFVFRKRDRIIVVRQLRKTLWLKHDHFIKREEYLQLLNQKY